MTAAGYQVTVRTVRVLRSCHEAYRKVMQTARAETTSGRSMVIGYVVGCGST